MTLSNETIAILVAYVLPTLIAAVRRHPQESPIAVVNLLLGWTLIGWIVAFAWSVASFKRP